MGLQKNIAQLKVSPAPGFRSAMRPGENDFSGKHNIRVRGVTKNKIQLTMRSSNRRWSNDDDYVASASV